MKKIILPALRSFSVVGFLLFLHLQMSCEVPKRIGFLAGLEIAGIAALIAAAKQVFNACCRPEIEHDVDAAIETVVPEVKEEVDSFIKQHQSALGSFVEDEFDAHYNTQAIEHALEADVHNGLDKITRSFVKQVTDKLGNKLTQEELESLKKFAN